MEKGQDTWLLEELNYSLVNIKNVTWFLRFSFQFDIVDIMFDFQLPNDIESLKECNVCQRPFQISQDLQ